jgi:small subunit ribosomal protein S9
MAEVNYHGTGRRKTSVARVWLRSGDGKILVNQRPFEEYFPRDAWKFHALEPLKLTQTLGSYDVLVDIKGGGLSSQAGAMRHGIARALLHLGDSVKKPLKTAGLLRRDPRMVERKKYGRRKARRGQQFSKR